SVCAEWRPQRHIPAALARGGSEIPEITGKHLLSRNKRAIDRWRRTLNRCLLSNKEEQLVLDDRSAERAAELIPFQAVLAGGVKVLCVERAVSEKFESIAVKRIRSGLRHGIDGAGRMMTILGRQSAGFHLEFLKRVGKRQRQIQIVLRIPMRAAVEHIVETAI